MTLNSLFANKCYPDQYKYRICQKYRLTSFERDVKLFPQHSIGNESVSSICSNNTVRVQCTRNPPKIFDFSVAFCAREVMKFRKIKRIFYFVISGFFFGFPRNRKTLFRHPIQRDCLLRGVECSLQHLSQGCHLQINKKAESIK